MTMKKTATNPTALLLGTALTVMSPALLAQSGQSATDPSGEPVGMEGAADGPEIVGTDGMIRYEDSDQMWEAISSNWDSLGERASERWGEIEQQALMDTGGDQDSLVSLVSESYDISEEEAAEEVTAWATSVDDGM